MTSDILIVQHFHSTSSCLNCLISTSCFILLLTNPLTVTPSIPRLSAEGNFGLPAHDPRPPPIIKIGPHNQTLPVDGVALLRCQAEGDPDPIIRWYRNGRPLLLTDTRLTKLDSGTLQISGNTYTGLEIAAFLYKYVLFTEGTDLRLSARFKVKQSFVIWIQGPNDRTDHSNLTQTGISPLNQYNLIA